MSEPTLALSAAREGLRQRCADAAMKAWDAQAVLCEHSQIIPIGAIVDAVLAVRDQDEETLRSENEDLRKRVEQAEAATARVRYLCDLTISASCRAGAIQQAEDTLAALNGTVGKS